jgi:hypothetical protein
MYRVMFSERGYAPRDDKIIGSTKINKYAAIQQACDDEIAIQQTHDDGAITWLLRHSVIGLIQPRNRLGIAPIDIANGIAHQIVEFLVAHLIVFAAVFAGVALAVLPLID